MFVRYFSFALALVTLRLGVYFTVSCDTLYTRRADSRERHRLSVTVMIFYFTTVRTNELRTTSQRRVTYNVLLEIFNRLVR